MKTYTIVAGVNGCGKSSLTGALRSELDNLGKIIDVDKIQLLVMGICWQCCLIAMRLLFTYARLEFRQYFFRELRQFGLPVCKNPGSGSLRFLFQALPARNGY